MSRYDVTLVYTASKCVSVEADSPEEAQEKAERKHGHAGLCHHCARDLEIDELARVDVYDEAGNLVNPPEDAPHEH
jgi:hypothetical protein